MNLNSRFAGVSRAARSLIGASGTDVLEAAEQGVPAVSAAVPPAANPDPKVEEEPADPAASEPAEDAEPQPANPAIETPPAAEANDAATIRADERARVTTVFASEHATGRERQAADMLGTSMSANEIVGLLAKAPKGGAAADPMLAALAAQPNPALGAGATDTTTTASAADSIWDKVRGTAAR